MYLSALAAFADGTLQVTGPQRRSIRRPASYDVIAEVVRTPSLETQLSGVPVGLDRLRATRRARLEYVGPWLPEPIVVPRSTNQPEDIAEMSDSLTTVFLVMLEQLSPEERLVVLLVDVFGESVWVNGRPGALISVSGRPYMVTAVDVVDGQIDRYWSFLNPDKLHAVHRQLNLV